MWFLPGRTDGCDHVVDRLWLKFIAWRSTVGARGNVRVNETCRSKRLRVDPVEGFECLIKSGRENVSKINLMQNLPLDSQKHNLNPIIQVYST